MITNCEGKEEEEKKSWKNIKQYVLQKKNDQDLPSVLHSK